MLSNYLQFLRAPTYFEKSHPVQWPEMLTLYGLYIVIGFLLGNGIDEIMEWLQISHQLENIGTVEIVLAILLVPVLEEGLFRLWLRVNKQTLWLSAILLLLTAALLTDYANYLFTIILSGVGILCILLAILGNEEKIEKTVARYFYILFYASIFLFGMAHIFNFTPLKGQVWLLAPILVLPQLIMGSMLGYVRSRYGIRYSILFHMAINASLLPFLLFD